MDSRKFRGGRGGTPAFVRPILNSLSEMRAEPMRPAQLNRKAEELLLEAFGAEVGATESAFAHGAVDLMVEHTHYFDGFGLFCSLPEGTSVAVRANKSEANRITILEDERGLKEAGDRALDVLLQGSDTRVDVAVISNTPFALSPRVGASALVATVRAVRALESRSSTEAEDLSGLDDPKGPDRHYEAARIMASRPTDEPAYVLVDTRTHEYLSLDVPSLERPGLAAVLFDTVGQAPVHGEHRKMLRTLTAALKDGPFPKIRSVRDIEHRQLEAALAAVDRAHRPLLTYLVTENGRVQKLVAAIQRRDWQMFGALLLMSHASKGTGLGLGTAETDLIVSGVENMSLEGMYGATRLSSANRAVLVAGQLFSIPPALERLRTSFEDKYEDSLTTLLL
ncbi:MAG: hypothetical protein HKN29_04170 [Rhodothermales bacterium]|nr:hypothetical protein [Rhodothermales bacterium]